MKPQYQVHKQTLTLYKCAFVHRSCPLRTASATQCAVRPEKPKICGTLTYLSFMIGDHLPMAKGRNYFR